MGERSENHKLFAVKCFNQTWELLEKVDRSLEETDRMIHAAHTSCYHWEYVGEALNLARGEWLISRVYAVLNRVESCRYHAERCLEITLDNNLIDFDLAFAYEAMARACSLAGDKIETEKYLTAARKAGGEITDKNDRNYFFSELESIQPG